MKKYEYKKEITPSLKYLNELGNEGWELITVAVSNVTNSFVYIFKREINE
jgi:hypothetical protein